jgi:hypothetical protein
LPRIPLRSKDNDFPLMMQRLQFPVQQAYALVPDSLVPGNPYIIWISIALNSKYMEHF